uniref:Uncharacterized protein n=1 Tax=Molossus molossus TaxID=27622 RepID=A0A7J8E365_MOLMO|nr:hypothetical protein HJG59_009045 [Molossus molossus]
MREAPGPRDHKTKTLEEVEGGGGGKWGPGHCVGELPLYLFQSLVGLGLPCIRGPSCSGGSVTSAVVMVMEGPLSQGTLHWPAHVNPQRGSGLCSLRVGAGCGPRTGPKTTAPLGLNPLLSAPSKPKL